MTATATADTFKVTQAGDPAPGACNANCSLREAIIAANDVPGRDTVRLGKRVHRIVRATPAEDAGETGDLDVHDDLRIVGRGAGRSVVDGEWAPIADPLIRVHAGNDLTLAGIRLQDGNSTGDYSALDFLGPGSLRMTAVQVVSNRAQYSAVATAGQARLSRVRFKRNVGLGCCSALYNFGPGEIRLTDVVFDRNRANNDTGAMYSSGASAVFNRVTFSRNRAGDVGGGALITAGSGSNVLRNVTFSQNTTTGSGGGLFVENGTGPVVLNNVTLTRNVADRDENSGSGNGGGIYLDGNTATLSNTIVSGNRDGGNGLDEFAGGSALDSDGFNLFGPGSMPPSLAGPGDITFNSGGAGLEGKLRRNGGFAPSHALKRSSRALNKGSNGSCEKRDQRGVKRPQGRRCDIGAYERKMKRR